jgi:hypothetical protein
MTLAPQPRAHDRDPRHDQRNKLMNTLVARGALPLFYAACIAVCWATLPGGVAASATESEARISFSVWEYAVFFALVWLAARSRGTSVYLMFKALPMLQLLHKAGSAQQPLFWWGVLLGLGGDMMLVFKYRWRPSLIIGGEHIESVRFCLFAFLSLLAAWSFFLGHLVYLWAFSAAPLSMSREYWVSWLGLFLIFMHEYYYFMLRTAPFVEFVFGLLYWTGISLMLLAAANAQHYLLVTGPAQFPFALVGAFLFVFSDLLVHWIMYVRPHDRLVESFILPTYFVAQLFILRSSDHVALLAH